MEHRKAYQVNCPARKPRRRAQRLYYEGGYDDPRHDPAKRLFEGRRADRRRRLPLDFSRPGAGEREGDHLRRNQHLQGLSGRHDLRHVRRDAFPVRNWDIIFRPEIVADALRRRVDPGVRRTHAHHRPDGFSSIGNLSAKSVETTVARYLSGIESSARDFSRRQPAAVEPFSRIVTKHTHQTHCIIGARAQGINEDRRLPLALLVNIARRSVRQLLLNVLVREKNGLSYNIEASYTPYY